MRSPLRHRLDHMYGVIERSYRVYKARKRAKRLSKPVKLTPELKRMYKEQVIPYWKPYGIKPPLSSVKMFYRIHGVIDPTFIPDTIWYGKVLPYFSNASFRRAIEDKNYHDVWFPHIKRPETIVKNIAGIYYDANSNIIDKTTAINLCLKQKEGIIKPSIDTGEGRLIKRYDTYTEDSEIASIFEQLNSNFIVQKIVKQHAKINALHPYSVNTIRMTSFLFDNEVHILSGIFRIGQNKNFVDNFAQKGIASPIEPNGTLKGKAIGIELNWMRETPDKQSLKDFKIPGYQNIIDVIKQEHLKLAHFKIIGWDFSVDDTETPILIEFNTSPNQTQIITGPMFQHLTQAVLEEVFIKKTYQKSQN